MNDTPANRELRSLFCEQFRCAPADFEKRVFWKCLYPHARVIAALLRLVKPALFERDHHFIRGFGNAKDWKDAKSEIVALRYEDRFHPRFLRNALRIRISRRKANQLAARLFQLRNSPQRAPTALLDREETSQKTGRLAHAEPYKTPGTPLFELRSKEHS